MKPGTDKLMQIKSWAEEGKIKGAVDSVYPLEDAPKVRREHDHALFGF